MKFRTIYISLALLFIAFILVNNAGGRAASAGQGNTGAPGDESLGPIPRTCVTCHGGGGQIEVELTITITDGNGMVVGEYIPGEEYTVKVNLETLAGDPAAFGFQIVSLFNSDNSDVNAWSFPSPNAQIATASSNGRSYTEHDSPSDSGLFEVKWTAPPAGSGSVTFYSCGNGVNLNGEPTGDGADCHQVQLSEAVSSSTNYSFGNIADFDLWPNINNQYTVIHLNSLTDKVYNIQLIRMDGTVILQKPWSVFQGENQIRIDLTDVAHGLYLVVLSDDRYYVQRKLVVR